MLKGLEYMHGMGIVHRDVKGGNILIGYDGVLKYCDFGLARLVDKNHSTLTGRVVTRWYRAPEIFLGDDFYDEKVDVWSVGCVFVELVTNGITPFKGDTDEDTLKLIWARCPFAQEDWPCLQKMPLYKKLKPTLDSLQYNSRTSPTSAPSSRSLGQQASTVPDFLIKYGYLWK